MPQGHNQNYKHISVKQKSIYYTFFNNSKNKTQKQHKDTSLRNWLHLLVKYCDRY